MRVQGYPVDTGASTPVNLKEAQATQTAQTNTATSEESGLQLSPLMQFTYSHKITELKYTQDETYMGYRKEDNSMALRVHSYTDVSLKQEDISIEATFSAESLGLTAENFKANGGKPYEFFLSFQQTDMQLQTTIEAKKITPNRTTEEILNDLSSALSKVFRKNGGKNISLELDDDAIRTLLADAKVSNVLKEIMQLISLINSMKSGENKGQEKIQIKGKGKEYLDVEQKTTLEGKQTNIMMKFTILPPAEKAASLSGTEAAGEAQLAAEPAVDLSV